MAHQLRLAALLLAFAANALAVSPGEVMRLVEDAQPAASAAVVPKHATPCVNGFAGVYPCSNIDLLAFEPVGAFGATATNSLWGWTDPQTGTEYALIGA